MHDSVVVPLYTEPPSNENPVRPRVGEFTNDCSRVGGVERELLAGPIGPAEDDELSAVVSGVRLYLDIDTLLNPPRLQRPPSVDRVDWWPRRGEIFHGHRFDDQRELHGVITDDEWNVRNDVELDQRNRHPSVHVLTRDDLRAFANGLVLTLEL
jgi:hypothetical protein